MNITPDILRRLAEAGITIEQAAAAIEILCPPPRIEPERVTVPLDNDGTARAPFAGRVVGAGPNGITFERSSAPRETVMTFPGLASDRPPFDEDAFSAFWAKFPKKLHKERAREAWPSAVQRFGVDEIMLYLEANISTELSAATFLKTLAGTPVSIF